MKATHRTAFVHAITTSDEETLKTIQTGTPCVLLVNAFDHYKMVFEVPGGHVIGWIPAEKTSPVV
jgi:hypothetical protein